MLWTRQIAFGVKCSQFSILLGMNSSPHGGIPGQRVAGMPKQAVEHAMRHPLLRALIPTNVGIFPHADGHKFESPNGTDQLVLIYCAKGRGWCEMGGHRHEVRPGDLLVIPPLTPHAFGADPDDAWTIPWVHLTGENVKMLLTQLGVTVERPILELGEDHKVLSLFDDTVTVAENDHPHDDHPLPCLANRRASFFRDPSAPPGTGRPHAFHKGSDRGVHRFHEAKPDGSAAAGSPGRGRKSFSVSI